MTTTLATLRDRVTQHLNDPSNLIFPTALLDEAIRTALASLSAVHFSILTLSGLDGAAATTLPPEDESTLVLGSVAHALDFRAVTLFEDAVPQDDFPDALASWASGLFVNLDSREGLPAALASWASDLHDRFQKLLAQIKTRTHQHSDQVPYSEWVWDEEGD